MFLILPDHWHCPSFLPLLHSTSAAQIERERTRKKIPQKNTAAISFRPSAVVSMLNESVLSWPGSLPIKLYSFSLPTKMLLF